MHSRNPALISMVRVSRREGGAGGSRARQVCGKVSCLGTVPCYSSSFILFHNQFPSWLGGGFLEMQMQKESLTHLLGLCSLFCYNLALVFLVTLETGAKENNCEIQNFRVRPWTMRAWGIICLGPSGAPGNPDMAKCFLPGQMVECVLWSYI